MADNQTPDTSGNYQSQNGILYQTSDGKPATHGQEVTFKKDGQDKIGNVIYGEVVEKK